MATWRRCEKCRKVLSDNDFDADSGICLGCAAQPVRAARAPVTTRRVAPSPSGRAVATEVLPASSPAPDRPKREGVVGRGDPEVRGRRARTHALQELSELHPDDFDQLLQEARRAEGLT